MRWACQKSQCCVGHCSWRLRLREWVAHYKSAGQSSMPPRKALPWQHQLVLESCCTACERLSGCEPWTKTKGCTRS